MSPRTSLFLAMRYLRPRKSFTTISMGLSILGPIIGVAVLIVVVSVMNGFHQQLRNRFFSLTSHILMSRFGEPIESPQTYVKELEKMDLPAKAMKNPGNRYFFLRYFGEDDTGNIEMMWGGTEQEVDPEIKGVYERLYGLIGGTGE